MTTPSITPEQALLRELRSWDMLDSVADGAFWRGRIDAVLLAASPYKVAPAVPDDVAPADAVFEKAMRETWGMVDPFSIPPASSYARGNYEGIVAALKTMRQNYQRMLTTSIAAAPRETGK